MMKQTALLTKLLNWLFPEAGPKQIIEHDINEMQSIIDTSYLEEEAEEGEVIIGNDMDTTERPKQLLNKIGQRNDLEEIDGNLSSLFWDLHTIECDKILYFR